MRATRRSFARLAIGVALLAPTSLLAQGAPAESQVRAAMAAFLDALNALDVARMDRAFTDDVTAFVPSAQSGIVTGRPAVTAIFQRFADQTRAAAPRAPLVPEGLRVEASGASGIAIFETHGTTPPVTRRRTFVFRRVGDRWLISHFHASDVPTPVSGNR